MQDPFSFVFFYSVWNEFSKQNIMICAVHYMVVNWLIGMPVSVREFDGIGFLAPGIGSEIKFPMFPYVS